MLIKSLLHNHKWCLSIVRYILQETEDGPSVFWDTSKLKIPTVINGLVIERTAHYITADSGLGFRLKWNGKVSIQINVIIILILAYH